MVDVDCIHRVFPHRDAGGGPSYRRHQFEVIRDAVSAFESGVETVVIEAPTGSGKTDIAKTVAMYQTRGFAKALADSRGTADPEGVIASSQGHMVTSMKMLQDAYLKTPGEVVLLKGKGNYVCRRDPRDAVSQMAGSSRRGSGDFTCQDADVFFGSSGCGETCPYLEARQRAHVRPLALHNFDSFLSQVTIGGVFPHQRGVITVDEAHNIEDKIIKFAAVEMDADLFARLGRKWEPPASEDEIGDWMHDIHEWLQLRARVVREDLAVIRSHHANRGTRISVDERRLRSLSWQLQTCDDMGRRASRYLSSLKSKSNKPLKWVAELDDRSLRLEPVQGGRFVREALLKWGQKKLLLSATFLDGAGAYSRALRLRTESTAKFAVPSTFPADRRPLIRRYVGDLGHRGYDGNAGALAKELLTIVGENPRTMGVIHCTSYDMAQGLREPMAGCRRLVWHGREDREETVRTFLAGGYPRDAVLVGVGLTEGYDFAGDLCRFQALIRIPYPYPSPRLKARAEVDPRHMDWRTCLTLVQTYGRGMRSADDHCRTYILDNMFDKFLSVNRGQLPAWFLEAVK